MMTSVCRYTISYLPHKGPDEGPEPGPLAQQRASGKIFRCMGVWEGRGSVAPWVRPSLEGESWYGSWRHAGKRWKGGRVYVGALHCASFGSRDPGIEWEPNTWGPFTLRLV